MGTFNFELTSPYDSAANRRTDAGGASVAAIVNASARQGGAERAEWLAEFLRVEYGIEAKIALAESGAELQSYARQAARGPSDFVIAAGGDGTIATVATALIGTEKRLGVLPLGTLNHFAKDLKIPLELEAAAKTLFEGRAVRVDAASVNGNFFINNSSLGLYPRAVALREQQQENGRSKWFAWAPALWSTFRYFPVLAVRLTAGERELVRRTPIIFVGNNRYELEGWGIGTRGCLDGGMLHVSVMRHSGRWAIARMLGFAFFGKLDQLEEFDSLCSKELWIESRRKRLTVALDGEVSLLQTPLHYEIHPRALTVMVPQ